MIFLAYLKLKKRVFDSLVPVFFLRTEVLVMGCLKGFAVFFLSQIY